MTGAETAASPEPLPQVAVGAVLRLAAGDWKYGRHPLILRVDGVREDLSVYYDGRWVWVSGDQLTADGTTMGHLDALVRVAALPSAPPTDRTQADRTQADRPRIARPPADGGPCEDDGHDPGDGERPMIAELECVVLDCPDPYGLAEFYQGVLGGEINHPDPRWSTDDDWATLHTPAGVVLAFQRAATHRAPRWPDPKHPQQFHLDLRVADLDAAEQEVLALGATVLDRGRDWRVYADPAGHPFCLLPNQSA